MTVTAAKNSTTPEPNEHLRPDPPKSSSADVTRIDELVERVYRVLYPLLRTWFHPPGEPVCQPGLTAHGCSRQAIGCADIVGLTVAAIEDRIANDPRMQDAKFANAAIRNQAFDIADEILTPGCWCGAGAKARHEDGCEPGWSRVDKWRRNPPAWLRWLLWDEPKRVAVVVSLLLDLRTNSQRPTADAFLVAATQAVYGIEPGQPDADLVADARSCLRDLTVERAGTPPATRKRGLRLSRWIDRLMFEKTMRPVAYDANSGVFLDGLATAQGESDRDGTARDKSDTKDGGSRDEDEPQDKGMDFGGANTDHSDDCELADSIGDGAASSGWDPDPEELERIRVLLQQTDDPEAPRLCDLINIILYPFASDKQVSAIASAHAEVLGHELDRLTDRLLQTSGHD